MKLPGRVMPLKILAMTAISAFIYAGAITLRTVLFGMDGGLIALLLFIMNVLLGHLAGELSERDAPVFSSFMTHSKAARFLSFMLHIRDSRCFTAALAAWVIIWIPILTSLILYRPFGTWRTLFEVLLSFVAYIISMKNSRLASTQILRNSAVYTGFFVLAVCLEVSYFISTLLYLRPWLFAVSYYFIFAYLIIKNQEDIDDNIFDKKHVEKSIIPKNIRRFNTFSVCVMFLAIILFFNLKPVMIYILQLLGSLMVLIIKGFLWIMYHIFPSQGATQQGGVPEQRIELFEQGTTLIYPLKNLISNIIKYFVLLYLSYRALLFLGRRLPGLVRKVARWIKKLLSIKNGEKAYETTDYSDETETLKPDRKNNHSRQLKKKVRKSSRDLRRISDPIEKIRYMYASVLCILPAIGICPEKSDTTMDILKKTSSKEVIYRELSPLTEIYNQIRYGEGLPGTEIVSEAEGHFEQAVKAIGKSDII